MTDPDFQALVDRGVQLKLMGFNYGELKNLLSADTGIPMTHSEYDKVKKHVQKRISTYDDSLSDVDEDMNTAILRMQMIQDQLLGMFTTMMNHWNAAQQGEMEFSSGHPVMPVKATDLAAIGQRIIQIDQERLSAKLKYPSAKAIAMQSLANNKAANNLLPSYNFSDDLDADEDSDNDTDDLNDYEITVMAR